MGFNKSLNMRLILGTCFVGSSLMMTACEAPTSVTAGNSSIEVTQSDTSPSPGASTDPTKSVCDPFGTTDTATPQNGLLSHLFYLQPNQTQYGDVESYMKYGTQADLDLYFNQVNVPTRSFSEGFMTQSGSLLQTPQGTTLYEWFALRFNSQIRIGKNDSVGRYQFAVISDDGSIFSVDQGLGLNTFINNDGETPTRMACATKGIDFNSTTNIPMQLDYFQGPRYNIAVMLLWREIPEITPGSNDNPSDLSDPMCGQSGNDLFFDWSVIPQIPNNNYIGLLSRGWKVLSADNFFLPSSTTPIVNPCTSPTPTPVPTSSQTVSPNPSTTPQPTPTNSTTGGGTSNPSPTPTSTCVGAFCGGGVTGI